MAVRQIGTEITLSGEKEFNDAMKSINNNLKGLKSDMAAVSATFDENANSVEALTAKNKILQDSYDQQHVKVDALNEMYNKTVKAYGANSAAADKYRIQLNNATVAMVKAEKELKANTAALEDAQRASEQTEDAVDDLSDANRRLSQTAVDAGDALEDMADQATESRNILPAVAQGLGNVATGAAQASAAVLAVGMGLGTAGITAMVTFAKEAAEAAKAAEEAGEALTSTDRKWLDFAGKLDRLDASASKAKRALGGILLPQLRTLSTEGANYLDSFAQSMEEAGGSSAEQADVIAEFMTRGAMLIADHLPEYAGAGFELLGGLIQGLKDGGPILWAEAAPLVRGFLDSLGENGPEYVEAAVGILTKLANYLAENAGKALEAGGDVLGEIVKGITSALPELGTAAGEMIGALAAYLLDPENIAAAVDAAWDLGVALAKGIWNALKETIKSIANVPGLVESMNINMQYQTTGTIGPSYFDFPGHADGLDRVPYDDYLARLHKDEMVLTAREADAYRKGRGKIRCIENLVIQTQHLDDAEIKRILDELNRLLGGDL